MLWLQFAIILGAALRCLSLFAFHHECNVVKPSRNESLSEKLKFLNSYKVSGVITSWKSKNVASIIEMAKSDRVSTMISDRKTSLHWISISDQKFLHNQTSGKCRAVTEAPLSSYTQLSVLSKDLSSLSTLVAGLVNFSKTSQGEFRGNRIVAGVEGVHWVACVNGTNKTANLQIEVVFAGDSDESLKPPSPHFNNPVILFIQVAEIGNFSDSGTLSSLLSLEFDSYSDVTPDDEHSFGTPPGTVCEGWKEAKIPLNVSDPFSIIAEYIDEKKVQSESTLYYSSGEQLVLISGARKSDMVPFINEKDVPAVVSSVIHDFSKGYEYFLDSTRCVRISSLPNNTGDVLSSTEGILTMRPVAQILLAPDLKFGNYGQLKTSNGRMLDVYRGIDNKSNDIVEVHFDGDQLECHSVYKLVNETPRLSSYMRFIRGSSDVVSTFTERIRSCFTQSSSAFIENNTFTFEVKSRSLQDVYAQGVQTVSSALANALAQIAPINPYRFRIFYDTGVDKTLRVFFSIDEKTDVKPSLVPMYNFTGSCADEVASSVFLEKLNATIFQGEWKFSVPIADKRAEDWIVKTKSLNHYSPPSTSGPSYSGYTGGAMFVLGVFSLLLGVAIGAGSVFFVTKRQRISTLAYQVFE